MRVRWDKITSWIVMCNSVPLICELLLYSKIIHSDPIRSDPYPRLHLKVMNTIMHACCYS